MSAVAAVVEPLKEFRKKLITRRTLFRQVFDTDKGLQVLKDLRNFCKVGQDIMVAGDPHATAYNLGKQRVYLRIESILRMDSETIDQISKGS